jgi:hypothetical protein
MFINHFQTRSDHNLLLTITTYYLQSQLTTYNHNLLLTITTYYLQSQLATYNHNLLLTITTCYLQSQLATYHHNLLLYYLQSQLATYNHNLLNIWIQRVTLDQSFQAGENIVSCGNYTVGRLQAPANLKCLRFIKWNIYIPLKWWSCYYVTHIFIILAQWHAVFTIYKLNDLSNFIYLVRIICFLFG